MQVNELECLNHGNIIGNKYSIFDGDWYYSPMETYQIVAIVHVPETNTMTVCNQSDYKLVTSE